MNGDKVETFIALAGQEVASRLHTGTHQERALGAQLLLSEVLEYVIKGLGITPEINGVKVTDPEAIKYLPREDKNPSPVEMLDGLADVAYTMYWNALRFGVPLEEGFDLVCDNNLEKFVHLEGWTLGEKTLEKSDWGCGRSISWPAEVASVTVVKVKGEFYAVGKDGRGKVRKPSSYRSVDLSPIVMEAAK